MLKKNNYYLKIEKLILEFCDGNRAEFARKLGVSAENIRNYLNGREPNIYFFIQVRKVFSVTYEWLLEDVDINAPIATSDESLLHRALADKDKIIEFLELNIKILEKTKHSSR